MHLNNKCKINKSASLFFTKDVRIAINLICFRNRPHPKAQSIWLKFRIVTPLFFKRFKKPEGKVLLKRVRLTQEEFQSNSLALQISLPPISMIMTENTFSHFVFADTFPKPTVVKDVQV